MGLYSGRESIKEQEKDAIVLRAVILEHMIPALNGCRYCYASFMKRFTRPSRALGKVFGSEILAGNQKSRKDMQGKSCSLAQLPIHTIPRRKYPAAQERCLSSLREAVSG